MLLIGVGWGVRPAVSLVGWALGAAGGFFIDAHMACDKEPGFEKPFVYFRVTR